MSCPGIGYGMRVKVDEGTCRRNELPADQAAQGGVQACQDLGGSWHAGLVPRVPPLTSTQSGRRGRHARRRPPPEPSHGDRPPGESRKSPPRRRSWARTGQRCAALPNRAGSSAGWKSGFAGRSPTPAPRKSVFLPGRPLAVPRYMQDSKVVQESRRLDVATAGQAQIGQKHCGQKQPNSELQDQSVRVSLKA